MQMEAPNGNGGGSKWSTLATTLPVRNVQALAADELAADAIERYIQPDIDAHAVLAEHSDDVPVIDLGKLLCLESVQAEAEKLRFACEEWGFFQLVNHGVPDEIIAGVKRDIEQFFQLPLDVKNAYAQCPGDLQGYGQAFVQSNDQKLDWSDMFVLYTQPPQARDMSYWPNQPHTFSYTGDSDSSLCSASTRRRKTRRLPDINKLAPMPVTECPPETDMDRLQDLAACCGFMSLEAIEKALKKHAKGKQIQGTSKLNE